MKNAAKTITQLVFFLFLFGGAMAQGQETDKSPNDAKFIPERDMVYSTKNTKARDAYIKGSTLLSENKVAEAHLFHNRPPDLPDPIRSV
ncbi:hypothetical protein AGMMS49928_02110 [Spirochaetia bacterium]|nr:hypothetical protein AGMMS49928_02110 [Spirochaetia bacterium]